MKYANFSQECMGVDTYTFQVLKFPAECRQKKNIHTAARFDLLRTSGLHIPSAFEGVFFFFQQVT